MNIQNIITQKEKSKEELVKKLNRRSGDESEEFNKLCIEINAELENGTSDNTTHKNESFHLNSINPLFDNTWVNSSNQKPLVKSQELMPGFSDTQAKPDKRLSTTSLRIPEGNYVYYPKKLGMPEETSSQKRDIAEITIPSSDSEDEARDDYTSEYTNHYHKQQSTKNPQCPFQLASLNNSNLYQSFFSTKDTYYTNASIKDNTINTNISIDQSIDFRTRMNNSNHSFLFNKSIPMFNKGTTPNSSMPNTFFSPTSISSCDFNNAFSYNNNIPIIIDKKQRKKKLDEQNDFAINDQEIIFGKDRRTTIMIKNIPSKYTCKELIAEFNQRFQNKYDLFFLPLDLDNENNLGYAFINFIDPLHIIHFCYCYKGKKWARFKSKKECDLSYALYQGREELVAFLNERSLKTKERKKYVLIKVKEPFPRIILPNSYYELIMFYRPNLANLVDFLMM